MKKAIIITLLLAFSHIAVLAQIYVKGVRLTPDNTGQYVELDPQFRPDGRCSFIADYGQPNPKQDYVSEADGKRLDFNSLVDGLNVFYAEGWEVAHITLVGNNRRYLLKRRY
ncbi:MAG: hypothetical protein KF734_13455 [Saprospiraceae bacterium]|nr:hypothetical protein [Saprospiraceae bacterium]